MLNDRALAAVRAALGQDRRQEVLDRRLAHRAGDADDPVGQPAPGVAAGRLQRRDRVVHDDRGAAVERARSVR